MRLEHLSVLALAGCVAALPTADRCDDLWTAAPKHLANLEVIVTRSYEENTTFTEPTAIPQYSAPVPHLPAFCRFGAYIHTSNSSKALFELWLPTDSWNGRFAEVGNGGFAGGVNYPALWGPIQQGFAVASTDTGHNGTSGDGTFAIGSPEKVVDFGGRAVHLTAEYSKKIIELYYSTPPTFSYFLGCSSGGKQGLKELQTYPETFDGVLAGAAAQWWTRLMGWIYHVNVHVNPQDSPGYVGSEAQLLAGREIMRQCDELDGLKDGIIVDPRGCKPDLGTLLCGEGQTEGCLRAEQIDNMQGILTNWTSTGGEWLFPGYEPGAPQYNASGVPYQLAPDYFAYSLLNRTEDDAPFYANVTELERILALADKLDVGGMNAIDGYIEPFLKRGKLITYVGLADPLIPAGMTHWYYEHVRESLGYTPSDSYRMFEVPGMGHCRGGYGATAFGGVDQRDSSQNGTAQPSIHDREHDMLRALVAWVEEGIAPSHIVASRYKENDRRLGVEFERKLCPYPQQGAYAGGDPKSHESFECKY